MEEGARRHCKRSALSGVLQREHAHKSRTEGRLQIGSRVGANKNGTPFSNPSRERLISRAKGPADRASGRSWTIP